MRSQVPKEPDSLSERVQKAVFFMGNCCKIPSFLNKLSEEVCQDTQLPGFPKMDILLFRVKGNGQTRLSSEVCPRCVENVNEPFDGVLPKIILINFRIITICK